MKHLKAWLAKTKQWERSIRLNEEKITIINKEKIAIQNYGTILAIEDDCVRLSTVEIIGKQLRVLSISQHYIHIEGLIESVNLRGRGQ